MVTTPSGRLRQVLRIRDTGLSDLKKILHGLAKSEVLVGFPEDTSDRTTELGLPDDGITNASLGYIHNTGMPEQNIPARPFMEPGIREAEESITNTLAKAARIALSRGGPDNVMQQMHRVGLVAATALKKKINEGVPPPLADSTLQDRARRGRKGAKMELERRGRGEQPSTLFAKPLIDTGQLRNAINYVIRDRKKRGR